MLTFDRGSFEYAVSREYGDDSLASADAFTRLVNVLQLDWHERKKLPELIGKTDRTLRRYLDTLRKSTHYSLEEEGTRLRLVDRGKS